MQGVQVIVHAQAQDVVNVLAVFASKVNCS